MPAQRVQVHRVADFSGGLNLRDDPIHLLPNEVPDCLNVDILPQGGVRRRGTTKPTGAAVAAAVPIRNAWTFLKPNSTSLIARYDQGGVTRVAQSTDGGASWSGAFSSTLVPVVGNYRATTMARVTVANSERMYFQRNTELAAFRWDGSTLAVLTDASGAYNNNIASPAGGKMPLARYIVSHLGFCFVAATKEGGTTYENRLRWSHPGEPEDWRTNDFISVGEGVDGDVITGLAPFKDRLFIFKRRSTWMLTGFDPSTFQIIKIADVGAVAQEAISVSELYGVAAFDEHQGVFLFSGGQAAPLWTKLSVALTDGTIQGAYLSRTTVGWLDARLYVSVPWGAQATSNTRTFVYDPAVGKGGAWFPYDFGLGQMLELDAPGAAIRIFGCSLTAPRLIELNVDNSQDVSAAGADTPFGSHVTTSWITVGAPGVRKRWRRPTFTFRTNSHTTTTTAVGSHLLDDPVLLDSPDYTIDGVALSGSVITGFEPTSLHVSAYMDFSTQSAKRQFNVTGEASVGGLVWGSGQWGDSWGETDSSLPVIGKGSALGLGNAVQLKIDGPADADWRLDEFELRFIPMRVR